MCLLIFPYIPSKYSNTNYVVKIITNSLRVSLLKSILQHCLKTPTPLCPFTPLCHPGVCFIHGLSLPKHRFGWRPFNLNPGEVSNCTAIVIIVLHFLRSLLASIIIAGGIRNIHLTSMTDITGCKFLKLTLQTHI